MVTDAILVTLPVRGKALLARCASERDGLPDTRSNTTSTFCSCENFEPLAIDTPLMFTLWDVSPFQGANMDMFPIPDTRIPACPPKLRQERRRDPLVYASGTVNVNVLPRPTSLSTHIFPPISSTNSFDIARPSPDPCRVLPPSRT